VVATFASPRGGHYLRVRLNGFLGELSSPDAGELHSA
jgi:hypothetical protein